MSILIDENTTFIIQGITGREAVNMTRECLDYGSKVVGGVTPGRGGRDVYGVPVYDTVKRDHRQAAASTAPSSPCPPAFVRDAAFEAIENGIKLIVIVTERIPRCEVAQIVELAGMHGARVIGPNCLGIISPGKAKMGGIGGPADDTRKAYTPGRIGVMSRSGGMTTEISNALTAAGLGQSTAVTIGGDAIIGSTYAELMPLFEADPETKAIVIYSEPGGPMDAQLADWVQREQLAPADRRLHGRALHGQDARHALRPRRHHRRGQAGHRRREDPPPGRGRHLGGRGDIGDPRAGEAGAGGGGR